MTTDAATDAQAATLESLSDGIQALWIKLGDQYEDWGERDIHVIVHKRHITPVVRTSFAEYGRREAQRAIGFLMLVKAGYQAQWKKQWQGRVQAIEDEVAENEKIVAECLTWDAVMDWMKSHGPLYSYIPSYFDFVKSIGKGKEKISYWRRREKTRPLFNRVEADRRHRDFGLADAGYTFQMAWQPVNTPGYKSALWELIPELQYVYP
jgi:hypothetical protein